MLRFLFVAFLFLFPSITFATPDIDSVKVGSFQSLGNEIALTKTRAWFSLHFDVSSSIEDVSQFLGAHSWSAQHRIAVHCEADRILLVELENPLASESALLYRLRELEESVHVHWAIAGAHTPDGRALGMDNQVLVLTHQTPNLALFRNRAKRAGATFVESLPFTNGMLLRVDTSTRSAVLNAAKFMRRFPDVLDAHPNFIRLKESRKIPKKVLNDPYLSDQWYIWKIQAPAAWELTTGNLAVIVSVIDDAIDVKHEEFQAPGKILSAAQWDFNGGDSDPSPSLGDDHGTAVSGIAVAVGDNGKGISGVCPDCKFLPVRQGYGSYTDAQMFKHVADWGAHVVNNSWGYYYPPTAVSQAITNAVKFGRGGKGTMVVFAAGNYNEDIDQVQDISVVEGVVAVASTDYNDNGQGYSNWGKSVGISAPADGQVSTDVSGQGGYSSGDYTSSFGGTSGAAPVVAGAAGLVFSVNPDLTEPQVKALLYTTTDKVGKSGYDANGHSLYYGYGRVNANKAVAAAAGVEAGAPVNPPPTGGGGGGSNPAASCNGSCGGESPSGCWCDTKCMDYGDCCADVCTQCGLNCGPGEGPGNEGDGGDPVQPDPVAPSKQLGDPCGSDSECVAGLYCQPVPGEGAYCAQTCTVQAANCPPGFECVVIGGQGACLVANGNMTSPEDPEEPELAPEEPGPTPEEPSTAEEGNPQANCVLGGEPCTHSAYACQRGNNVADINGVCEARGPLDSGALCVNDAECGTRFCEHSTENEKRCLVPCDTTDRCAQDSLCVQLPALSVVGACRWMADEENLSGSEVVIVSTGSNAGGCQTGQGQSSSVAFLLFALLLLIFSLKMRSAKPTKLRD